MATIVDNVPNQKSPVMRTGITGLDQILGGGFLHGNSILLRGTPGSGKSALGMQLVAAGAIQYNEPGIIVSFEQFPEQLYRDAQSFGWDFRELEKAGKLRVFFARRDDLYSSFAEKESTAITMVTDATIDLRARRILVDSASYFWRLPIPEEEQRKVFFEFVMKLKGIGLTPILTTEMKEGEPVVSAEEFTVDTIVKLDHVSANTIGGMRPRTIEIVKTRGQGVVEGQHPFRITPEGIRVSPCMQVAVNDFREDLCTEDRCGTGVDDLDNLLHGGLDAGSITMIAGMTGTGKTILAGHFLAAGLEQGIPGVYVTNSERPSQLIRNMDKRGLKFSEHVAAGRLVVLPGRPAGMQPIEFRMTLEDAMESIGARRVVIDGLRDLLRGMSCDSEREYSLTLYNQLMQQRGVTAVFTWRVNDIAGLSSLASISYAGMFDDILYVGLVEMHSHLKRVISIFKTRGEACDNDLRELLIHPKEVRVSNFFSGMSGILMGSATGHLEEGGREVLEPLVRIRDFVNSAQVETPEQARLVIDSIRSEFNVLAEKMREHFNVGDGGH